MVPGLHAIALGKEPEPVLPVEEIAVKDPDKSAWSALCGKYQKPDDDLYVDEVLLRECELFLRLRKDSGRSMDRKLYPLGGNEFGVKRYPVVFKFEDGTLSYGGYNCKKM